MTRCLPWKVAVQPPTATHDTRNAEALNNYPLANGPSLLIDEPPILARGARPEDGGEITLHPVGDWPVHWTWDEYIEVCIENFFP